jgi:hypothetical protein
MNADEENKGFTGVHRFHRGYGFVFSRALEYLTELPKRCTRLRTWFDTRQAKVLIWIWIDVFD